MEILVFIKERFLSVYKVNSDAKATNFDSIKFSKIRSRSVDNSTFSEN